MIPPTAAAKLNALTDASDDAQAVLNSTVRHANDIERAIKLNPFGESAPDLKKELARLQAVLPAHRPRKSCRRLADISPTASPQHNN